MITKTQKITYTAIARDCNSWDPSTGIGCETWNCGHKHHTVSAACKCLQNMGNAGCSYHAKIEGSDSSLWHIDGYQIDD